MLLVLTGILQFYVSLQLEKSASYSTEHCVKEWLRTSIIRWFKVIFYIITPNFRNHYKTGKDSFTVAAINAINR